MPPPIAVSTLAIVLIVVAVLVVLLLVGGILGARRRDRLLAERFAGDVAAADQALEQARAADRGWDRVTMEEACRAALAEARPDFDYDQLHLVLVDDRPGVEEDRAHFAALGSGGEARVVMARDGDRWVAERVEQPAAVAPGIADLIPGFHPESDLERVVTADPELLEGLRWGRPRRGHPEGSVAAHVSDLLATIDRWGETGARRQDLRFLALVHDAMKYRVREWMPKTGENHHAVRARRFAERYTDDERLLAALELHDRPYALWRRLRRRGSIDDAAVEGMLARIPDLDLFVTFVELDGSTEGKNPEPVEWLRERVAELRPG